tara:strand:- start:2608 stop:3381 length:774 start_codon:yes stop_codon:yes gene_type:complete
MPGMPGNSAIAGHRTTWGAPFGNIEKLEPGDEIKIQTIQGSFTYVVLEQNGGRGNFIVSPNEFDVLNQNFDSSPNRLTLVSCHPKLTARNRIIVVAELIGNSAESFERPDYLNQPRFTFAFDEEVVAEALGEDGFEGPPQDAIEQDPSVENAEESIVETQGAKSNLSEISDVSATAENLTPTTQPQQVSGFGEGLSGDRSAITPSITWGLALITLIMTSGFIAKRWRRWPTYFLSLAPIITVMLVWFFNLDRALPSY